MLKNGVNQEIGKRLETIWLPDYVLVLTSSGWCKIEEIKEGITEIAYFLNELREILYFRVCNKQTWNFEGNLQGEGKILFHKADIQIYEAEDSEFFLTRHFLDAKARTIQEVPYSGNLTRFDINPIVSYKFKTDKDGNIVSLDYILLEN